MDHLVLDIGGQVGALAIYVPAERDGHEIEISPAASAPGGPGGPGQRGRTHNVVRPRLAGPALRYAAVFPSLAAGEYTVWRDTATAAGTVTVHGGRVAEYHLD
jgi:hypothetical protein